MIRKINNLPIRHKLSLIVLCTAGLLIGVMATVITAEKYFEYRSSLVEDMTTLSTIIGANSTAALAFRDATTANEILAALKAEKNIIAASLFDADGRSFAFYFKPASIEAPFSHEVYLKALQGELTEFTKLNRSYRFQSGVMDLAHPIFLNEKNIGQLVIRTDLSSLQHSIRIFILLMIGFSLVLFTAAHLICTCLNRSIVGPITKLVSTMQAVTIRQDYSVRVPIYHSDEIGVLIDGFNDMLTQIQKRDDEIGNHSNRLEELVEKRTLDLKQSNKKLVLEIEERKSVQNKLAHAQKMEAIGTLAGGVAHDLNNILSGVVSYPELLLLNMGPEDPMHKPLKIIMASGKKAAAIVQDLLTLARRGVKVNESMDLSELIRDYLESPEYAKLMSFHPLCEVAYTAESQLPSVLGSPVHLSKLVMNLVSNAVEAMPHGGQVRLAVSKEYVIDPIPGFKQWRKGDYVNLTVTDNGTGIPKEDIHRIFEPFYTKKVMGRSGTGLGMAVVWGTIKDHEGHITVQSEEGKGTIFSIYLPANTVAVPAKFEKPSEVIQQGDSQTILIVDDSEDQRLLASQILLRLGYRPKTADSGETAVAMVKERSFDLVILDMLMPPGMDGLDTYREIVRIRPTQKAIIASGFSESKRVREARTMGVSEYVRKPYTLSQISEAVRAALSGDISTI